MFFCVLFSHHDLDLKMLNEDMKLVVARCSLALKWTSNTTRKVVEIQVCLFWEANVEQTKSFHIKPTFP